MKRMLFAALTVVIILASALFVASSGSADGLTKSKAAVTFNKDVAQILFKNCAECHRPGEAAPMSLLSYKDARPWARSIREKVLSREMPPWHADSHVGQFSNDPRLTQAEIDTITAWVDGGAKEGEPRDMPPAPKFVEGWSIGRPDLILKMPDEFTLEANGPDEYQHFVIDPGFTEDKYVQMAEARPGNRRIVHHIVASILPPPQGDQPQKPLTREEIEKRRAEPAPILYKEGFLLRLRPDAPVYDDGCQLPSGGGGSQLDGGGQARVPVLLCGFAPGEKPTIREPGAVKKIPAGSKIILQVHYSKTAGQVEKDRSMIGLVFAKQPPRKELFSHMISNNYFRIPPGAENHRVTACWTAPQDIHLTNALPHMHKRGKAWAGLLMYDATGHMAAQLLPLDRPKFASGNRLHGTQEEIKAAFDGYFAYFGPYEVNEAEGVVIHHVKGSIFPNDVGKDNIRYYEFSGDRLTFIPTNMVDGKLIPKSSATVRLTWERVK
jgi:mono/diheme cytochrome c family protein